MRWIEVSVPWPERGEEPLLVDALRRAGAVEVRRDGARTVALFPPDDNPEAVVRSVRSVVVASTSLDRAEPTWRWEEGGGWADRWSAEFEPRRVTPGIRVTGPDDASPGPGITIRLAPGIGFGTASHPTTRTCLRLLEHRVGNGDRIADVGTGSGILAIAAALLGARRVLAYESDAAAAGSARANIALNGVRGRVRVRERAVGQAGPGRVRRFDGVVANIQEDVLLPLVAGLARSVRRGGWLVLGGVAESSRDALTERVADVGLRLSEVVLDAGWWGAAFER